MSLLLLIDGYNVVAPVAGPRRRDGRKIDPNWLHRERMLLIRRLAKHVPPEVRARTCVVFDAANPPKDQPSEYRFEGIDIRFAVEYPEADDLIEELIASHSAPKQLIVVSSDHRVQNAAKRRGCSTFNSHDFLDDLLDGRLRIQTDAAKDDATEESGQGRGVQTKNISDDKVDPKEVDQWMRDFGFDE